MTDQAGQVYAVSGEPGIGYAQNLVNPYFSSSFTTGVEPSAGVVDPTTGTPTTHAIPSPTSYAYYFIGFIVLLAVMKYASEHEKAKMDPKILRIGVWNFFSVGILATFFIVGFKVILAKYPVAGLSQIIGAA